MTWLDPISQCSYCSSQWNCSFSCFDLCGYTLCYTTTTSLSGLRLFSASGNKSSNWLTRSMWISTTSTAKSPLRAQKLHLFFMPFRLGNKEIMKKSNPKKVCWDVLQPQHFATYLWHYPTQSTPKRTELYPLCNRICLGGQVPLPKRKASKVLWFATVHWAKHAACVSQLLAWLDFQSEGLIERFRKKIQSFFRWKHMLVKKLVPRSAFCLAKVIPSKCWRIHLVLAICLKPDFETILFWRTLHMMSNLFILKFNKNWTLLARLISGIFSDSGSHPGSPALRRSCSCWSMAATSASRKTWSIHIPQYPAHDLRTEVITELEKFDKQIVMQ